MRRAFQILVLSDDSQIDAAVRLSELVKAASRGFGFAAFAVREIVRRNDAVVHQTGPCFDIATEGFSPGGREAPM